MFNKNLISYKDFDAINISKIYSICKRKDSDNNKHYILFILGKDLSTWWNFADDIETRNAVFDYIINKYSIESITDANLAGLKLNNFDELK